MYGVDSVNGTAMAHIERSDTLEVYKLGGRAAILTNHFSLTSYPASSFTSPFIFITMADFFTSSSLSAVASKGVREAKTVPPVHSDKAEATAATKSAGSNFSMCEIIM
ncbi:hypothetical protein OPQ81_011531 [Rhizoctonia solani]|nr:hypothetical protein OPQ81_011531 [Rhizoctonia solani]